MDEQIDNERYHAIETLLNDCIIAHQEAIIIRLVMQLEEDYKELAELATMGEYNSTWTHLKVMNYVTYET